MVIREAMVLAGGKGTRLRSVVEELPKSLAPIRNKPFLHYQLRQLLKAGIDRTYLLTGYKREMIVDQIGDSFGEMSIEYISEEEPLGTGGAVWQSLKAVNGEHYFVFNGDTIFDVPLAQMAGEHQKQKADISLAVKPLKNFSRYGRVIIDDYTRRITQFEEKKPVKEGYINGGIYIINRALVDAYSMPLKFSLEKDLFERYVNELKIHAFPSDGYFLDIGIPEDYERAQDEFARFED